MGRFFIRIMAAAEGGEYVVSIHAAENLRERGIPEWQAVAGLSEGQLRSERPDDTPNPSVEVEQVLPDGTSVLAV